MIELTETTFKDVTLGSVFFDPSTGQKFQKIDEAVSPSRNKYGQQYNARGERKKNFDLNDIVKAHKTHIKNG